MVHAWQDFDGDHKGMPALMMEENTVRSICDCGSPFAVFHEDGDFLKTPSLVSAVLLPAMAL